MTDDGILPRRLRHWARRQPNAELIVEAETGNTLTYREALARVDAMRLVLGDEPGCVAVALPGGIASAVVWLSALTYGHSLVPLSPQATAAEARRLFALFPPRLVIAEDAAAAQRLAAEAPQPARALGWQEVHERMLATPPDAQAQARVVRPTPSPGRVCLTTSGSTGAPKGVVLEERQLAWTSEQVRRSHRLTPADRGLTALPFFHVNAPVVSLCASLLAGSCVVIAPRFRRDQFWSWVERHRVTWASVVPTIVALLLQTERPDFLPGTLRFVRSASAPLPALQLRRFEQRFGIPVIETYGLTEAASQICANPLPPKRHVPGSVGKPTGVTLRICRPRDAGSVATEASEMVGSVRAPESLPQGTIGEVCIAGGGVIAAYLHGAQSPAFAGGWFRTGDLGYLDADGYLHLTGRLRDLIIRGGENVTPREVEEALLEHPGVAEAAVVGRPDPVFGEQVVAYVVPHEGGGTPDDDELRACCAARLSPYKVPVAFVVVESLPRTPNGKIDRVRLRREQAADQPVAAAAASVWVA